MTYCSSISFTRLSDSARRGSGSKVKLPTLTKVLSLDLPKAVAGLVALNFLLAIGCAVFINQSSISGYRMAELEAAKTRLAGENSQMELKLAASRAVRGSQSEALQGFEPVISVEYVALPSIVVLR